MTVDSLLDLLGEKRVQLHVDQGELIVRAPSGAIDAGLAQTLKGMKGELLAALRDRPSNKLSRITPDKLTLVKLSQESIDAIVEQVEGGVANIQDIYPLTPLQEGMLFHHLLDSDGDPYAEAHLLFFQSRPQIEKFLAAVQQVINRHDIFRTNFIWERSEQPVQVVLRHAALQIEFVELDPKQGPILQQLTARYDPKLCRLDVRKAPLLRCYAAADENGRWILRVLCHHLAIDHMTLELMVEETRAIQQGRLQDLPAPVPFRNFVAQARFGVSREEHEAFFKKMLGDIDEPTAPFGLLNVQSNGGDSTEVSQMLPLELSQSIRKQARHLGVSSATVMHVAWALVLARATGLQDVVFGTVLFGRMQGDAQADRALGLFINTLPVRICVDGQEVAQCLKQTNALLVELLRHEHAPLALAQRCSGVTGQMPLFTSLVNYRYSTPNEPLPDADFEYLKGQERTNYPLTLEIDDYGQDFSVTVQASSPIAPHRISDFMVRALEELLEALENTPRRSVRDLDVLPKAEQQLVLQEWNRAERSFPVDKCIHEIFEEQVARTPEAPALTWEGASLNYRELNAQANQLAHYLLKLGLGPDKLVAICCDRSPEMLVAILAVLKAGGAYVPLDPAYASERLHDIAQDSRPIALLRDAVGREALQGWAPDNLPIVDLGTANSPWACESPQNLDATGIGVTPHHLAYVIYTSGSTGKPKGVMVEHANVARLFSATEAWFGFGSQDVWSLFHSFSFDFSVWEMWGALLYGGRLVIVPLKIARSPEEFYALLCEQKVTVLNQTPSAFQQLIAAQSQSVSAHQLRHIVFGGESLEVHKLKGWYLNNHEQGTQLTNMYGITETTVHVTYCPLAASEIDGWSASPIGERIPDLQLYILNDQSQPVPVGVVGELYVGGAGVARGYLNQPDLTAERFPANPFRAGERLYKTGDLGRWRADGSIEYLGRNDFQVKIRGFRIELGEIEAKLAQVEGVREVVVLAREDSPGDQRLVAYYTGAEGLDAEILREYGARTMPSYMVPAAYVYMERLPLTPNGKLDRKALEAPTGEAYIQREYAAPEGETEELLASIWSELLQVERVGRHDDFFELGGHSLLAVQAVSRLRRRLNVELRDIFQYPTLAGLAAAVGQKAAPTDESLPPSRPERLPLSFSQKRLWFLNELDPAAGVAYHLPVVLRLHGVLDHGVLRRALDHLVARHEILRTTFVKGDDGQPVQEIGPAESGFLLEVQDLRRLREEERETAVKRISASEARRWFDLATGPLIRGVLLQLTGEEHALLLTQHHIISDAWSIAILVREMNALYRALREGKNNSLPALAWQYADFAVWERSQLAGARLEAEQQFWCDQLAGAPEFLELPSDRPRPEAQSYAGDRLQVQLPAALIQKLRKVSRHHGVTLFMTLISSWAVLLSRLSGQEEVVVGTPVANRQRQEWESLVGFFVNTLALRVKLAEDPSIAQLLDQVKGTTLAAFSHQGFPFEQVVEAVAPTRSLSHSPIVQVTLSLNDTLGAAELMLPDLRVTVEESPVGTSQVDLNMWLAEAGEDVTGNLEYATDLFDRTTIERIVRRWETLLRAIAEGADQPVSWLPLLPETERRQVVEEFNATEMEYRKDRCIHQLFEEQVEKTPDALALACAGQQLSYRELNRRANQVAHYLVQLGLQPEDRVGLCVERGLNMVIGLLGILKAGGAYVPLDASHPAERLAYQIEDSAPVVMLTQRSLADRLPVKVMMELLIDEAEGELAVCSDRNPKPEELGLEPHHLAYVIYTSGSTGKPKGVLVEHQGLCNLMAAQMRYLGVKQDSRVLQFAPLSFDASIWEIVMMLCRGASLHLAQHGEVLAGGTLMRMIQESGITHATLPPAILATLPCEARVLDSLGTLILAGEKLTSRLATQWSKDLRLINAYGPTETTVCATVHECRPESGDPPIGQPIGNTQIYILDSHREPVPIVVVGEIYIGGSQLARGYLNRPDLTADRFLENPFRVGERIYKTGDLGRWNADGTIEYLGRNDFQVKVRGFRIELGEIEAKLLQIEGVQEAVVLVREDAPGDRQLVAYFTGASSVDAEMLREHVARTLPNYMVPAAYIHLESLPLTSHGKLDRKALPTSGEQAYAKREYAAPQGETEQTLAEIWSELLQVTQIGRYDNFFKLGGHSLLAVSLTERMRQKGLHVDVRALFTAPTLAELAAQVGAESREVRIPPNLIPADAARITPDMLTLVELSQESIDSIVEGVEGGIANLQDIYPLAPLQDGILFHYMLDSQRDPYKEACLLGFRSRSRLERFLLAMCRVVERHDILRTAFVWKGLEEPVQVVWRRAALPVEFIELNPQLGDIAQQLETRCASAEYQLNLSCAPLLRCSAAQDEENGRWLLHVRFHHLTVDHTTLEVLLNEANAIEQGRLEQLPTPTPFRNFVAQARFGVSRQEHEAFFTKMLGDIDRPTAPFGLLNLQGDGRDVHESERTLPSLLSQAIRNQVRNLGVSAASLMHLAWAIVLAKITGDQDVVFGTVLFGRMQGGAHADRTLGLFINTLPVRIHLGEQGVDQLLKDTHALLARLMRHEHAPLALAQNCSAVPPQTPLFNSLMNYRYSQQSEQGRGIGADGDIEYLSGQERTNYPLTLSVDDLGEDFCLTAQVSNPIAPQRVCDLMERAVEQLVKALQDNPQCAARQINVLSEAEWQRVVYEFNSTAAEFHSEKCVHELFEEQVEKLSAAVAVELGGSSLSYRELNVRANQMAHYLRNLGVGPDRLVAICAQRSPELVVAMLAVLKAGGAYVPLDPAYASQRLCDTVQSSSPDVLLWDSVGRKALDSWEPDGVPVLDLQDGNPAWAQELAENLDIADIGVSPRDLAYVIYTSGSTGKPNGVMVEHRSLCNLVSWHVQVFNLQVGSRSSSMAGVGFDACTWEIWPSLCSGGTLILSPINAASHPQDLLRWWQLQELEVSFLVTPLAELAYATGHVNEGVRTVLTGGDRLKRWPEELPPGQALVNNYGPTENTVVATSGVLHKDDATLHIGRPIANTQMYILDKGMEPVPVGVEGELYIGGVQVARGYLGRPELTAERFVQNPFREGERMYKTGDLGRWREDGAIEYLGRNDFQVKIRGFRIELGEIEAKLAQVEGVREVVVVAREEEGGEARLVAYYTGEEAPEGERLREQAKQSLPGYMVPGAYVRMEQLPLTANGKLDRKALPAPEGQAYGQREYEEPQGEMEQGMAEIWRELLGVERVGRHDNFFELGGHSLLAVQMGSRLRKRMGVELALSEVFAYPELRQLAARVVRSVGVEEEGIGVIERGGRLRLSLAQQRLWFLSQLEGGSRAYHISGAVQLGGELDGGALKRALGEIVRRHEVLRTRYEVVEGEAVQVVWEEGEVELELEERDVRAAGKEGNEGKGEARRGAEEARRLLAEHAGARFDLERGLPVRAMLVRLGEQEHVLQVVMHHIASDGWSVGVFLKELSQLYRVYVEGGESPLEELRIQYADYGEWQRKRLEGGEWERQGEFWRENLKGAPVLLEVPGDRVRPVEQEYEGGNVKVELGEELSGKLKRLSQRHGVTLYMTLLASWGAVLSRLSGQQEVMVGSAVAGRNRAEIESLIGFFINTLVLRVDVQGEPTVSELLERVKRQVLGAQQHQDLPFDQVVEMVKPPRSTGHTPLFQVMLDWNNTPESRLQMPGLRVSQWESEQKTAQFDLTLILQESAEGIVGELNYATALFDQGTVERYRDYWQRLVEAMTRGDEQRVGQLAMLSEEERRQVVEEFNATGKEYPSDRCIHELFEEQVEKNPNALAVDCGGQQVSYKELNRRANQLAHYLRGLGIGPERRVVICMERGLEMVVGLLAVMKAGGAYVPLDPSYPAERMAYILADSAPAAVLTSSATGWVVREHWEDGGRLLDVQADAGRWNRLSKENPTRAEVGLSAEDVAYVIYTSGSTGKPKGVMIEHRNLVNYTLDAIGWFGIESGERVLQQNSLSFDLSLEEMMPALVGGATLMPSEEPFGVKRRGEKQASMVHLTAAHWHNLVGEWGQSVEQAREQLRGVRMINVTGDAVSPQKLKEWEAIKPQGTGLINTYGPTEITISCSAAYVRYEAGVSRVSIGKPFANTSMYILDGYGEPVPIGVAGELYIGGAGVGRGYLNRPELTGERFLPDGIGGGQRMYRTGDMARWLGNGEIEFIGRNDWQVKVRGFRIELGEIEAKLGQVQGVREVVVVAREEGPGKQRLVAYYTGEEALEAHGLWLEASQRLPEYMVPGAYVYLEKLPLTPNGKVDRKALPEPEGEAYAQQVYEAPEGDIERILAGIWAELLKVERVGRHDNFFALGGHSLLAISLIERMRQEALHANVNLLFTASTLAEVAAGTTRVTEIVL